MFPFLSSRIQLFRDIVFWRRGGETFFYVALFELIFICALFKLKDPIFLISAIIVYFFMTDASYTAKYTQIPPNLKNHVSLFQIYLTIIRHHTIFLFMSTLTTAALIFVFNSLYYSSVLIIFEIFNFILYVHFQFTQKEKLYFTHVTDKLIDMEINFFQMFNIQPDNMSLLSTVVTASYLRDLSYYDLVNYNTSITDCLEFLDHIKGVMNDHKIESECKKKIKILWAKQQDHRDNVIRLKQSIKRDMPIVELEREVRECFLLAELKDIVENTYKAKDEIAKMEFKKKLVLEEKKEKKPILPEDDSWINEICYGYEKPHKKNKQTNQNNNNNNSNKNSNNSNSNSKNNNNTNSYMEIALQPPPKSMQVEKSEKQRRIEEKKKMKKQQEIENRRREELERKRKLAQQEQELKEKRKQEEEIRRKKKEEEAELLRKQKEEEEKREMERKKKEEEEMLERKHQEEEEIELKKQQEFIKKQEEEMQHQIERRKKEQSKHYEKPSSPFDTYEPKRRLSRDSNIQKEAYHPSYPPKSGRGHNPNQFKQYQSNIIQYKINSPEESNTNLKYNEHNNTHETETFEKNATIEDYKATIEEYKAKIQMLEREMELKFQEQELNKYKNESTTASTETVENQHQNYQYNSQQQEATIHSQFQNYSNPIQQNVATTIPSGQVFIPQQFPQNQMQQMQLNPFQDQQMFQNYIPPQPQNSIYDHQQMFPNYMQMQAQFPQGNYQNMGTTQYQYYDPNIQQNQAQEHSFPSVIPPEATQNLQAQQIQQTQYLMPQDDREQSWEERIAILAQPRRRRRGHKQDNA